MDGITEARCWQALRDGSVGRVAVVDEHSGIEIFPVNYVIEHGTIVFRTARGTKLAAVEDGPPVAFEIESSGEDGAGPVSVVAIGRAEPIAEHAELLDAFDIDLSTWHSSAKPFFVRIVPESVRGSPLPV